MLFSSFSKITVYTGAIMTSIYSLKTIFVIFSDGSRMQHCSIPVHKRKFRTNWSLSTLHLWKKPGSYLLHGSSDQINGPSVSFTVESNGPSLTKWTMLHHWLNGPCCSDGPPISSVTMVTLVWGGFGGLSGHILIHRTKLPLKLMGNHWQIDHSGPMAHRKSKTKDNPKVLSF